MIVDINPEQFGVGVEVRKHPTVNVYCLSNGCLYFPGALHKHPCVTKGSLNRKGYYVYTSNGKQYRVHRLIAEAFIPNTDNKPTVDHINRIRTDNRVSNLRWASLSEQKNNSELVINRLSLGVRQSEDSDAYTQAWRQYAKDTIYMYEPIRRWRNTHKEWRKAHWQEVKQHCKECHGRRHKEY